MDFSLSEEQQLIKETIDKFVEKDYTFAARNKLLESEARFSRDHWKRFAELGWLGIALPEAYGGFGGGAIETMLICESFGSVMLLEPFLTTVVMGGNALQLGASEEQKKDLLPQLIAGELTLALAYAEAESGYNLANVSCEAKFSGDKCVLSGEKIVVLNAPSADKLIVSARSSGEQSDEAGISLFIVDANAAGLELAEYLTMDGARGANVKFNNTPATILGSRGEGFAVLENVIDLATAAICAQALGAMESTYERTIEYLKTRKQFDVPIGSFQVLQHRLVDMYMAVESSRSMVYMVSIGVMSKDQKNRREAVSSAKSYIGQQARNLGQDAVQMHGGVGMTEELDIGHFFRYLTLFCQTFGSTDYHLEEFAQLTQ